MRLSRALLVAIQWETESTFKCTFFEPCAFRISIWPGGMRPAINSNSVSFRWKASR